NGGWLAFGPKAVKVYSATGDGGSTLINPQDVTSNLLGKILRIDVDGGSPYAIPPDNPFVGMTGDDEIWAYGLRNPWRNAFDPSTGDLYIADVGQNAWEEISFQPASSTGGENYGWRCREGAHDFNITANCAGETFVDPIHEYGHGGSPFRCSITGGEIYHGSEIPDLVGTYFYADWCSDSIWSFRVVGGVVTEFEERTAELAPGGGLSIANITSFGTDANGEMYICDHTTGNGEVFKIVAAVGSDCNNNGEEDSCDIASGASLDGDKNGVPDECETALTPLPPDVAWPKNRYLTFKPNNVAAVALQVELSASLNHPDAVGFTRWVDVPDGEGIARLSHSPITRIWTEEEVHATGCEISPLATYQIRATIDGGNTFSAPLVVETSPLPDGGKSWGDTVGSFDGTEWAPPQQVVNIGDAVAAIQKWQQLPGAPHTSVCDLHPQFINVVVNFNDVFLTILAFKGDPYPFGCPADPCQDNIANPCP
ncbi:MAG: PQQ-dependent sugar dehydrogenase, partial [Planctomycetes bacterium]|nr:PQQ-dependent sugar dehydrogenase [Planctomycetota bacterium]